MTRFNALVLIVLSLASAWPVWAQESLQKVPITIQVINGECLKRRGSDRCELPKPKPDHTLRKFCRKTWHDREAFLKKVEAREIATDELVPIIKAYETGARGCRENRVFAQNLLETAIGNPVSLKADPILIEMAAERTMGDPLYPRRLNGPIGDLRNRTVELENTYWLLAGKPRDPLHRMPDADRRDFLAKAENWKSATARLNQNNEPTRMAIDMLWDKNGTRFDPQAALALAAQRVSPLVTWRAVKELMTGGVVSRDERRGRALLAASSFDPQSPELIEARYLNQKLEFEELHSPDVTVARAAWQAHVARGAVEDIAIEPVAAPNDIAKTGGFLELDKRPDQLKLRAGFIGDDDYPSAAFRTNEDGLISVWLIFRPNGKPGWFQMAGGSPKLREVLARLMRRRLLKDWQLASYAGRYVRGPMPATWFRLSDCETDSPHAVVPAPASVETVNWRCPEPIIVTPRYPIH